MPIRIIKHEAIPQCVSYEVRYPDGRPSRYFYWEHSGGGKLKLTDVKEMFLQMKDRA